MRKHLKIKKILVVIILLLSLMNDAVANHSLIDDQIAMASQTVNIGDYIQFGRYNDAPILWRVIHKEANGDPILLSDRILTLKAFDAKGSYHSEIIRKSNGSNYYKNSNLRQWLNSSSPNSGANMIDWIQNDPNSTNVLNGKNSYSTEKGFLADGNFTSTERSLIKPYTHKVMLAAKDQAKKDGGTTTHRYVSYLGQSTRNYDSDAFFHMLTDRVFLLSVKQLDDWVFSNSVILGSQYHQTTPTAEAVAQTSNKISYFNTDYYWNYWLNTPHAEYEHYVRNVDSIGAIYNEYAFDDNIGVRPALSLDIKSTTFSDDGTGTSMKPFIVIASSISPNDDLLMPSTPTNLKVNATGINEVNLEWSTSTDNIGVIEYKLFQDGSFVETITAVENNKSTISYIHKGLNAKTAYSFSVRARDAAGNASEQSNTVYVTTESDVKNIKIGDYIQFGRYNDVPILWRVIHKDAKGDPILFADRILTIKAFDSRGNYHPVGTRRDFGSNYYKDSNIRQWLNSSSPNSGVNMIEWIQNDPSVVNMWNGFNPYKSEKGFLADGNFTSTERSLIKPYTHKVLLAGVDQAKKTGGTANHDNKWDISNVIQNYDTTAYFQNVTDNIFLLSVKQLKEWVYDNRWVLGTSYHIAKPTAEAVTQSTYMDIRLNSSSNWHYFLNTPYTEYDNYVRLVDNEGRVFHYYAVDDSLGIRPALHLNFSSAIFASGGSGTSNNPYVVTGGSSAPADTAAPSAPSNLGANSVSANALTLAWGASTDNVGVTGYEIYQDGVLIDTISTRNYAVSGLVADTQYAFAVRARDAAGNRSVASEIIYVRTLKDVDDESPNEVTDLEVLSWSITSSSLSVSFTSVINIRGVARYQIEWRDNQGNVQSGSIYVTDQYKDNYEYYISNLKSYTKYWIKVRAYDRAGNVSNWSKEIEDRTKDNLKPSVPSNIRASQITSTSFKLSWSSSQDNAGVNGYKISLNGSLFRTSQTNSMTISNRKPGTTYTLRVLAYDAAGNESSYSSPISVTTSGGGLTFNGALSVTVQSYNSLTLSWNCAQSSVGIREYRIRRDNLQVAVTPSNRCNAEVGGIESGSNKTYTVIAVDREGKTVSKTLRYTFSPTLRLSGNSLSFNGRPVRLSSPPKTSDALVPYKDVFSALGLTSSYNASTKTIRASKPGGAQITLTVGIKPKATVDKRTFNLNSPVQLYGGVPFVPLNFFGQALGVKVQR